jgi:nucleotide-binding universal stress UspA family protein
VYRSILVPVDGSTLAERSLAVASTLATQLSSNLHVVHVHHERVVDELPVYGLSGDAARAAAEQYVVAVADRLRATGSGQVSATVLEGSAAQAIAEYVAKTGVDLIVMSSHGRTGMSRFWLGSVADAVIRTVTVPVLMVRASADAAAAPGAFERILLPLDGSSRAEMAIPHAIAIARLNPSHVHLLSVEERAEDLRLSVWGLAAAEPDDLPARLERADHYLHSVVSRFQPEWPPATVSVEARGGHRVGETIAQAAVEQDSDLIAMATHGRGASRLLLGSVADKVIRGTACSILLVRTGSGVRVDS